MKIAIIGYSGAGKSTLAQKLSQFYSIPKLHMDTLQFQPNWQDSDRDWMKSEMKKFLTTHSDWVIDGNYSWCCYEERMEQADQIIFLNFSPWTCLFRALKRYLTYRGKVRESMAAGCPERFDWDFIRWILWDGRSKSAKERYKGIQETYPEKVILLRSQKEIDHFLDNLAYNKKNQRT
ncbi:AAA domain protein [Streptococcus oralis SK304]|uniref:AAA domain protein n=3 Tax=Streptococcus TaxID=1301 RepID=J5GSP3_STROR|nr:MULTISPECIES: DNA topology modulation protein [Streptococcus]EJP21063.1 AAA domain protein [Streptococcus oralis SK304]ORJ28078.1 topology modulation protein [Streptococcus oralis subsp. tigurinus]